MQYYHIQFSISSDMLHYNKIWYSKNHFSSDEWHLIPALEKPYDSHPCLNQTKNSNTQTNYYLQSLFCSEVNRLANSLNHRLPQYFI